MSSRRGTCSAVGLVPSRATASSTAPTNSGLPPVAVSRAAQKASSGSRPCSFCASTRDRGTPQRFGANRGGLRIRDQLRDECRIAALALRRPRRRDHQQRHPLQPPGQVEQPAQRGGVRPVQVVDRDKRRLQKGHVGRQPVQAVQDRKRALRGRVLRTGQWRGPEQRLNQRGRPREQLRADIRIGRREQRLEQLTHDPVGELALELAAAGGQHPHPRRAGDRPRLASRRVLPMPALPSMTTNRPPPPRAASASACSAATWASRSSSNPAVPPEGTTPASTITTNPQNPAEPTV